MKICYLGPFNSYALQPMIPALTPEVSRKIGQKGGTGLPPLVAAAGRKGHDVTIISLYSTIDREMNFVNGNMTYCCLPMRKRGVGRDYFHEERKLLLSKILASDADIIHAHWTYEYALAAVKSKKPNVIVTARDCPLDILKYVGPSYLPSFICAQYVYKNAKYLTAVSPYVYDYIINKVSTEMIVIPNAVEEKIFDIYQERKQTIPDSHTFTVVSTLQWGRLKNVKNALLGFDAFCKKAVNAKYLLFGKGLEENGPGHSWATELGLSRNILFMGERSNTEILDSLKLASVFLHPSLTEACSMSINEALAAGVPVVGGKNSGGVPWQLQWGLGGVLVDVLNPLEIARGLAFIYGEKASVAQIVTNGKQWAEKWCRMENVIDRYEQVYRHIINETRTCG